MASPPGARDLEARVSELQSLVISLQKDLRAGGVGSDPQFELQRLEAVNRALELEMAELKKDHQAHVTDLVLQLGRIESDLGARLADLRENFAQVPDLEARRANERRVANDSALVARKRVFGIRASKLTEMLRVPDYATIHNLFVTIVIMAGLNIFITDYFENGAVMDLSLIWWCFGDFNWAAAIWLCMLAATFSIVPIAWVVHHSRGVVRGVFVLVYVALQLAMYAIPAYYARLWDFPPATSMALLLEQTRLSLKIHSYLRESYPSSLDGYEHSTVRPEALLETTVPRGGTLAQPWANWSVADEIGAYVYFLFVPTLLYRRSYPQGFGVRYGFVVRSFAEVVATVYFTYIVFRFVGPQFEKKAHEALTLKTLTLSVFSSMMPAMLIYIMGFFALLHAWMNAFAELLRFGDRHFYDDWWNATSWADFYRRWNGVVHDWIAAYLYRDAMTYLGLRRGAAQLFSFAVSAVIHEYIIFAALGFCYPILLILFAGPGIVFISLTEKRKARFWNIFMWFNLALGNGMLMVLYSREWYARRAPQICVAAPSSTSWWMPRSWVVGVSDCQELLSPQ